MFPFQEWESTLIYLTTWARTEYENPALRSAQQRITQREVKESSEPHSLTRHGTKYAVHKHFQDSTYIHKPFSRYSLWPWTYRTVSSEGIAVCRSSPATFWLLRTIAVCLTLTTRFLISLSPFWPCMSQVSPYVLLALSPVLHTFGLPLSSTELQVQTYIHSLPFFYSETFPFPTPESMFTLTLTMFTSIIHKNEIFRSPWWCSG